MTASTIKKSLHKLTRPIAASRAHSLLAYLLDMPRHSLRGSLHSDRSLRFCNNFISIK